ncbi:hypothetical protein CYMTET_52938 [Cymbomonas tetramitiformis]|uniref:TNFR-Cys domain-containing protein n=1 Tax=Cymbomonas tetramitiformis TaxID=36881 RepID=A0AAE0BI95_9CHLO|nr:hypothetical protein CYMTET_52938 [Cymbomonas tetramitiformis]
MSGWLGREKTIFLVCYVLVKFSADGGAFAARDGSVADQDFNSPPTADGFIRRLQEEFRPPGERVSFQASVPCAGGYVENTTLAANQTACHRNFPDEAPVPISCTSHDDCETGLYCQMGFQEQGSASRPGFCDFCSSCCASLPVPLAAGEDSCGHCACTACNTTSDCEAIHQYCSSASEDVLTRVAAPGNVTFTQYAGDCIPRAAEMRLTVAVSSHVPAGEYRWVIAKEPGFGRLVVQLDHYVTSNGSDVLYVYEINGSAGMLLDQFTGEKTPTSSASAVGLKSENENQRQKAGAARIVGTRGFEMHHTLDSGQEKVFLLCCEAQ